MSSLSPSPSPPAPPGPSLPALAGERRSFSASLGRWLDILGPAIALLVIFGFFSFQVPGWRFLSFDNIDNILRQTAVPAVAALGMTFIIIAGGIDLSLGSMVALCAVIVAVLLKRVHHVDPDGNPITWLKLYPIAWPLFVAAIGILTGVLCGVVNGILVVGLRLAPFIITLGMMMILRGMAKGFAEEQAVTPSHQWLNNIVAPVDLPAAWTTGHFYPFPLKYIALAPGIWLTIGLAILMAIILNYSRFGRHVIAVGSNENTARLCGIPVNRTKLWVYTLGGLFGGFAGLFLFSRLTQGSPTAANAFELDVIAAVVIGGASLNGGKGSIFGSLVGALIMSVIARGCSQIHVPDLMQRLPWFKSAIGLPTYVQEIVTGIIIIIAVLLDSLRQRKAA
jgi:ribose/xylose/arabinose/galactoside ABC-type transport system permease subunit